MMKHFFKKKLKVGLAMPFAKPIVSLITHHPKLVKVIFTAYSMMSSRSDPIRNHQFYLGVNRVNKMIN